MPEVLITGPAGRLEGRYRHGRDPQAPVALVLHHDPRLGGNMNSRAAYELYQTFAARGFSTLRINFRGVGKSQGTYDEGEGEMSDAAAALDWLQTVNPNTSKLWVSGVSFGAYIAMQLLMRRPEIGRFVVASLPANAYDFTFLAPCPSGGLVVHGEQDKAVPTNYVQDLVEKIRKQRGLPIAMKTLPCNDHLFQEHHAALTDTVAAYVDRELATSYAREAA